MHLTPLTPAQIESELAQLSGWSLENGQITKQYTFAAYKSGVVFAVAVAHVADRLDHHPDIHIGYNKVTISCNTHDVNGISSLDFDLARLIESL